MTRHAFAIDLRRCSGCGACILACKNENNLSDGIFWAHFKSWTSGIFPNVRYSFLPTLCNHCDDAPCVAACRLEPKAMYKDENGLTLHDADRCIGCRFCENACPYNAISFNARQPHAYWRDDSAIIPGGTSSPSEVLERVGGDTIPYYNQERAATYPGIRKAGVVEKCTGCDHLVSEGLEPRCVDTCPAKARIFGDIDDPDSQVSRLASQPSAHVLDANGTSAKPKVFYVNRFSTI